MWQVSAKKANAAASTADSKNDNNNDYNHNAKHSMDDGSSVSSHETIDSMPPSSPSLKKTTTAIPSSKGKKKSMIKKKGGSLFFTVARFIFMDLVVLTPLAIFCALHVVDVVKDNYLMKQMELQLWNEDRQVMENTYYNRVCETKSLTAHDAPELIIDPEAGTQAAVEKMMIHGASVYPDLLKPETAKELRDYIVSENKRTDDLIMVIENKNRWSFPIQVDQHPSIPKALKEILSKDYLVDALEAIMGPNPAVIEFTGITSAYGAKIQRMHQDVIPGSSAAHHNRNFVPSYSLFIPLQNTTKAMGATEVCPGTQHFAADCNDICERDAFHVSGSQDNWPMGFGALVNQQTTHRGPAHVGRGQPERVLFILTFAPRPRFDDKQVETRILGSGGSYSMHWSQWGHTLKDYADPERRMNFFWRHLKSMGIYKPWGHDWGWDYPTSVSQRIIHEELGFSADEVGKAVEKGRFDWIPKFLHGRVLGSDDPTEEWVTFLTETLSNVKSFAGTWYVRLVSTYFALIIGGALLLYAAGYISSPKQRVLQCIYRVSLTHGAVVILAYLYYSSVTRGSWARNITRGIQYHSPSQRNNPELPGTLPTEFDVMIFDDLQSPYLGSTAFVYDYAHPGNFKWMNMTRGYGAGFTGLTPTLQSRLCTDLVEWNLAEHQSRILIKNVDFEWAAAPMQLALRICHKNLVGRDNEWKRYAVKWIDFLIMEVRYGYWREAAMSKKHVEPLLNALQDKLLGFKWKSANKTDVMILEVEEDASVPFSILPLTLDFKIADDLNRPARSALPPRPQPEEPYSAAWVEEGDIVESNYNGYSGEYYRAEIGRPMATSSTWNVIYEDGDEDPSICRTCIRPFVPYQVGEEADWTDMTDFHPCEITAVNGDDSYNIIIMDSGDIIQNVSAAQLRRTSGTPGTKLLVLEIGARVRAQFPGEPPNQLFPGTIHQDYGNGYYAIAYDDGDYAPQIPKSMIQSLE